MRFFTGLIAVLVLATGARGNIDGFNPPGGWTYNQSDAGRPASFSDGNTLHFTTGDRETRSLFFRNPEPITSHFVAVFGYRATDFEPSNARQGIALVLQANSAGLAALGGGDGGLGYAGMTRSIAVTLDSTTIPQQTYSGYFSNGTIGDGNIITHVSVFSFTQLFLRVEYNAPDLRVVIVDPSAPGLYFESRYLLGSLASILDSQSAFVGFTAGTGDNVGNGGANQYISDFSFFVPEPSLLAMVMVAALMRRRRPLGSAREGPAA